MADVCTDDRFEIIDKFKKELIKQTNIETSPEEMAVIDNILFRFWQIGWLSDIIFAEEMWKKFEKALLYGEEK